MCKSLLWECWLCWLCLFIVSSYLIQPEQPHQSLLHIYFLSLLHLNCSAILWLILWTCCVMSYVHLSFCLHVCLFFYFVSLSVWLFFYKLLLNQNGPILFLMNLCLLFLNDFVANYSLIHVIVNIFHGSIEINVYLNWKCKKKFGSNSFLTLWAF